MSDTLTLFVNKSDSHCECSHVSRGVRPSDHECRHCGGTFTHISSDYSGMAALVSALRPDLIPDFPFENWWGSEAGRQAQRELQELDDD